MNKSKRFTQWAMALDDRWTRLAMDLWPDLHHMTWEQCQDEMTRPLTEHDLWTA